MSTTRRLRALTLLVMILVIIAACRRQEESVPTAVPTAIPPTTIATRPATAVPTTPPPAQATATPVAPLQANRVDPADIDWSPQVIYSSPAPGEEVLLDGAFTIRFDQPMDQQSVEAAFIAQQSNSGRTISGEFTWPSPDTLVFTPRTDLVRQQTYRIQINDTAKGSNGMPLTEPIDLALQAVGFLEISQVIPAPGTENVQPDTAVTVLFNRPVVPLTTTGQQANLPQPLTFDPPVAGQGEWVSTSIYRFTPDEPLAGGATYDLTIPAGLADVTGGVLERTASWRIRTLQPEVVGVTPGGGAERIIPTDPIIIEFNMAMDRPSTETAVSLVSINRVSVPLQSEWQRNDRFLVVTPTVQLDLDTLYQIRVSDAARAAGGTSPLSREFISDFSTVPFPAVVNTNPANNQVAERWQRGFTLEFASPMVIDDFAERILIEPTPANVNYFYGGSTSDYLNVDFTYEPNVTYTVIIPGDAADPYGNTLGRDYTFSFTAPPGGPLASFNLPNLVSQLSTSFETNVEIIHRNVSRLDVDLYNLGLPLNLLGSPYDIYDYQPAADPLRSWQIRTDTPRERVGIYNLPLGGDGRTLPTGAYLLTIAAPELTEDTLYWQNRRHLLIIADTNIVVKEMFGMVHVWVTDIGSGQPAAGRNLTLYNNQGVATATAVSDNNGFAAFPYNIDGYLEGVTVVSNQPGGVGFGIARSYWNNGVEPYRFDLNTNPNSELPLTAYIYTDRPIYRPGDVVYFKGIVRQPNYGRYTLPPKQTLDLTIALDSFFGDKSFTNTLAVEINPDGIFTGSYTLPPDVALGSYRLSLASTDFEASRTFTVAEYRAPEFLVETTAAAPELLRGQATSATLSASYFFGGPATDLEVNYTLYADTYRLSVPGPYYSFGDDGGFFYTDFGPFVGSGSALGNFIVSGSGTTDGNGRFTIPLPANLLAGQDAGSYRVTIEASVQTLGATPVTSRTEIIFHAAEQYVGVTPLDVIQRAGSEATVSLLTTGWDGKPVGSRPVEVIIYRREWERIRSTNFASYNTSWEPIDTEVARVAVTTDSRGEAEASFTPESGGTYLVVATVTDGGGRTQTSSTLIWVTDSSYAGWRTDQREKRMELIPDQDSYRPGDTARLLVQSPFTGPVQAWLTIERGNLLEQRLITLQTSSDVVEIPITADFAPNVHVSLTAVKPVTPGDETNPYADIRLGMAELVVSPEQLTLTITLSPQSDQYGPRDTAVYDIQVTDASGRGVSADLSLALVDLAVLTLKEDNAPPIQDAFYARQPLRSQTGGSLFISGEGLDVEVPLEILGLGGGGGDFAAEAAVGRVAQADDESIRRDFPDTAFWRASITTDANGRATVDIPLPDSLTTWRLSAKAVTADTLVGQSQVDVVVSLPLLVRPLTPRFFTVGDTMQIGTYVNNNTAAAIDADVTIEAEGIVVNSATTQSVTVPANGRSLILWPITVTDAQHANLTFRVSGGGFRDAAKPSFGEGPDQLIPIYRYNATDITGTAGVLAEPGRQVEALLLPANADLTAGSVDVAISPSLAAALLDTVRVVNEEPRLANCAHTIIDELLPNAALALAAQQLNAPALNTIRPELDTAISADLADLLAAVQDDGGWGWCYARESNPWLTAYALLALDKLAEAGYTIPAPVVDNAISYLEMQLIGGRSITTRNEANRQAFFLFVLAEHGVLVADELDALVTAQRTRLDPYAAALVALAYERNNNASAAQQSLLADLNDTAVLSATGAHWEDQDQDFGNLSSDIRGSAIVLWALTQIEPDNGLLPAAVRWLMAARTLERWPTYHETAWSTLALSTWMATTGELEANYDYALNVNLQPVVAGTFSQDNLADSVDLSLPLSGMVADDVNFFSFIHQPGPGSLYYTLHLNSALPASEVTAVSRGITLQRTYYDAACDPNTTECQPIDTIAAGDRVRVELTIIAPNDLLYAIITDAIPAGTEAVDPGLATSAALADGISRVDEPYRFGYWGWWYFNRIEYRDDRVVFLSEFLPAGTYQYTYFLETTLPGTFQVRPAIGYEEFFPEVFGRSDGSLFTITE